MEIIHPVGEPSSGITTQNASNPIKTHDKPCVRNGKVQLLGHVQGGKKQNHGTAPVDKHRDRKDPDISLQPGESLLIE